MKQFVFAIVLAAMAINCNKKNESPEPVVSTVDSSDLTEAEPVADTLGAKSFCYLGVTGKDSIFVSLDDNLGTIIGKMAYKNHEKDSSKGELSGFKSGDTLKLTYEFQSEGSTSKRDIFFIQKDGNLIEGTGNQKDDNGTMRYADEKKISYKNDAHLKSADCQAISKVLK